MPDDWQSKFEVLNEQYEEFKSSSQELEQDLEAELAEVIGIRSSCPSAHWPMHITLFLLAPRPSKSPKNSKMSFGN